MLGLLALVAASIFFGAAFYINVAEQPARMALTDTAMLAEWQPAYKRGYAMQAPLAVLGFVCGTAAWWLGGSPAFLLGGLLMIANLPWTLAIMMPTNKVLAGIAPAEGNSEIRPLIAKWGRLHAMRTAFGFLAAAAFLWGNAV